MAENEILLSPHSINEPQTAAEAAEAAMKYQAAATKAPTVAPAAAPARAPAHAPTPSPTVHAAAAPKEEHHERPHVGRPAKR